LLVQLLLLHRAWIAYVRTRLPSDRVQEPNLRTILQALYTAAPDTGEIEVSALLERLPDGQPRELAARLVLESLGDEGVQQQIDDCLTAIQRREIDAQLKSLKEEMHEAEQQADMVRLGQLQRRFAELRRALITRAQSVAQRPETSVASSRAPQL
jgi:hypothetical protein